MTIGYILNSNKTVAETDDLEAWAESFEDSQNRIVEQTQLENGYWISTVFLGVDHNPLGSFPELFETMVFKQQSWTGQDIRHYSTYSQAELGHKRMVAKWKHPSAELAETK